MLYNEFCRLLSFYFIFSQLLGAVYVGNKYKKYIFRSKKNCVILNLIFIQIWEPLILPVKLNVLVMSCATVLLLGSDYSDAMSAVFQHTVYVYTFEINYLYLIIRNFMLNNNFD